MKKQLFAIFLLCTLPSAHSLPQSIDFGRGEVTVTVPSSYDSAEDTPLIILLHGYGSTGERQDSYLGFSRIADKYNFLLVAPTGTRESSGRQATFWNSTSACCNFQEPKIDDNAYIMGIIERMKEEYNINSSQVYLVGHSNGGFMSYQLAYNNSESIAAIVSLAGASHADERAAPEHPVHVLQIHGTNDSTIRYEGNDIQGNDYPGAKESVIQWAAYNQCTNEGEERELRDLDSSLEGHESSVLLYNKGCQGVGSAELWTISEGSHVPRVSESFSSQVVEWLYDHPKN